MLDDLWYLTGRIGRYNQILANILIADTLVLKQQNCCIYSVECIYLAERQFYINSNIKSETI